MNFINGLIKYTNITTWVACKNTKREFIWFEMDKVYYEIAKERINNHIPWQ